MKTAVEDNREFVMAALEENQKNIRELVMESYRDIQTGKGRDYKEFFSEMERRYGYAEV